MKTHKISSAHITPQQAYEIARGGYRLELSDDAPETVQARLVEYHKMTEPLKDFYDKLGKLAVVEGQEEVADTTALVFAALED